MSIDAALTLAVSVLLPVMFFEAHLGALNRMTYPATAVLLAGFLYRRRSPWFLGLCVCLFCASPLVRRLTDFQASWDPANPVLIAPYLACGFTAFDLLPYASGRRAPFVSPFLIFLGCVAYGVLLAVINGRVTSGLVDALRWSVGPLCAVHLLRNADRRPAAERVIVNCLLVAGPAMAIYGMAQFLDPAPWDRDWMINVVDLGLDSIGRPLPFEVRVFGTMNSPASLAMWLLVSSLLYLGQPMFLLLPATTMIMTCLALTQYRAGWGGLVVGLLCLLLTGAARERLRVITFAIAISFGCSFLVLVPEINNTISSRFDTLGRLSNDASGMDRISEYQAFFSNTESIVGGQGLAIAGATRRLDGQVAVVIDGGLIQPFLAFGVFGGTALLASVLALVFAIWRGPKVPYGRIPLYRAIILGTFVQLVFGNVLMGEGGFCAWLAIGLVLSTICRHDHQNWPRPRPMA